MPKGTPASPLAAMDADEVHLVIPARIARELHSVLFPEDEAHPFYGLGERGAFCALARSTGTERVSLLVRDVIHPTSAADLGRGRQGGTSGKNDGEDDSLLDRLNEIFASGSSLEFGYQFSEEYHRRAIKRARELEGGLLRVHTHPGGVTPSPVDKQSAERVFEEDEGRLPPGAPFGAAITNNDGAWSARFYERSAEGVEVTDATAVRIVGPEFEKRPTATAARGPAGATGTVATDQQDSTIQLWEEEGQKRLAGLRIGLVGCGGVGSILTEHLARMGVAHLVLVDFDRLEEANFNRAQGATRMDARQSRLKTRVAQRVAHEAATAPDFDTTVVDGSVVEDDPEYAAVPALLDCDIILTAVDAARPRYVLDQLASAHCIPVIDGGSRLHADQDGVLRPEAKVEVAATGPGWPCFECQRVWRAEDVQYERENPRFRGERGYVEGGVNPDQEPRSPSVIGVNSLVAGLMQRRLKAVVLGVASRMVGTVRLSLLDVETDWSSTIGCHEDCDRPPIAAGDGYELPTGTDWTMRFEREDIPDPEVIVADDVEDLLDDDILDLE